MTLNLNNNKNFAKTVVNVKPTKIVNEFRLFDFTEVLSFFSPNVWSNPYTLEINQGDFIIPKIINPF